MSEYTYNETVIEHDGSQDHFGVSTGERKWKNRLATLAKKRPDECILMTQNEDGSVFYHVPESWVVIRPPKTVTMSDERRAELAERMRSLKNKGTDRAENADF